ncbi:MAG TPA: hypothetical protein VM598_06095, partial [Bdellovibrionota bacterium]|nr:hypothetical protein [Bdellovibrionota bacterium]
CPGFDLGPTETRRTLVARDAKAMVTKLLCPDGQSCPPLTIWTNNLPAYSPHSPDSLIALISANKFGDYQSIKLLLEIKQVAQKWVAPILQAYATVKRFCDKGGFGTRGDFVKPNETGSAYIARAKIASQDRPRRVRTKPGKGYITVEDLLEIGVEEVMLRDIQNNYIGREQGEMAELLKVLGSDFPEGYLRDRIEAAQKEFAEGGEFITTPGDRLEPYPPTNLLCTEIRDRWRAINEISLTLNGGAAGRMPITFYETKWPGHETILEAPVPQEKVPN